MKNRTKLSGIAVVAVVTAAMVLALTGCQNPEDSESKGTPVKFEYLFADGSSMTYTTTTLELIFDRKIIDLSAADITLTAGSTGARKGELTPSKYNDKYYLAVSGITSGGSVTVNVSKSGYDITGGPKTVTVYYYTPPPLGIVVTFTDVKANIESHKGMEGTTKLTLTFDQDITGLSAEDITLSWPSGVHALTDIGTVEKRTLTKTGTGVYELAVNVVKEGLIGVSVSKSGYTINDEKNVFVSLHVQSGNIGNIAVTFTSLTANNSTVVGTTRLTLTSFTRDIDGLSDKDVFLQAGSTQALAGYLYRTGTGVYDLDIYHVIVSGNVTVDVLKSGYTISGGPKTVYIYKN